jgi:hypothetical protein
MSLAAMTLVAIISCRQGTTSKEPSILKISAKDLRVLDEKQWSEVKEIQGKEARVIQQDEVVFTVPAWWGNNARPNEGDIFVLEIDYQDVVSNPFIVSSFGNCANSIKYAEGPANNGGKPNGLSELHRIAGGNTTEWKTAMVPVSWDYLYAGAGNPKGAGNQEFSIRLEGDDKNLPISEVRIRRATKDDEVQYNADTRAWIKKRQDKYYTETATPSVADLPAEWKSKDCIPYVRSYLTPILPFDVPEAEEMGAVMKIRMALNEIESSQLGVYANGKHLEDVSISVSELKNDKGELLKPKTNLYTVEYAFIQGGKNAPHKLDAQRIWPLFETPVKTGNSQAFWLSFETGEETVRPGVYKGEISILVKGDETATLPLEIEVLPVQLLTLDEAGLSMGGCVTGFVPFHNITYAMNHNVNATNLWFASVRPGMSHIDGKLVLDFTLIDEWMKGARRLGLKNITYFLGGNPYGFPRTMSIESELFVLRQKEGTRAEKFNQFLKLAADESNRGKVLDEIRGDYSQWVTEVSEHALANGWPELILTPFDEPAKHRQKPYRKEGHLDDELVIGTGPWIKGHFEDACKLIRKAAPTVRIYGSIHHSSGIEFLPVINVFCTNAIDMDPALGDKVRQGGNDKYFWQYTGVGAGSDPARMRYSYGYYFGAFNSRGSLLWAYNWGSRFDTTEGNNWMICWDTPFSTIPTLSYEGLREAWDDRRYIETLKKTATAKGVGKEVNAFLENIFTQAVHSRAEGGDDTVDDFWNETTQLKKLDEWRFVIANKIIEISE